MEANYSMAVKPPLIGLPGRRKRASEMTGFPKVFDNRDVDLYFADYARGVMEAGGIPVHLPIDVDPAAVGERLDGIVLPGGTDIDPVRFGAEPHPELFTPEPERDDLELGLLSAALDADVPVLGICRGIQIVNVHQGGTLHQHVPEHGRFDLPVDTTIHQVSFAEGSILGELYGPAAEVNSLHHQTVDSARPRPDRHRKVRRRHRRGIGDGRSSGRRPMAPRANAHPSLPTPSSAGWWNGPPASPACGPGRSTTG